MSAPGAAADEAFALGLQATAGAALVWVGLLLWADVLTLVHAVLAVVLGLPVLLIVVSCLLGVWLGYDEHALAEVAAGRVAAEEESEPRP